MNNRIELLIIFNVIFLFGIFTKVVKAFPVLLNMGGLFAVIALSVWLILLFSLVLKRNK